METKILYPLLALCTLFVSSCTESKWSNRVDHDYSKNIKKSFKSVLPKLDEIDFIKMIGHKPSDQELELGRMLFNDPVLSRNNDVSCATCHLTNHGYADGNALNVGSLGLGGPDGNTVGRSLGKGKLSTNRTIGEDSFGYYADSFMFRNSLSTVNVIYRLNKSRNTGLFWDGRFGDLNFQTLLPVHTKEELCGSNPIALDDKGMNPFRKNGPFFNEPIKIHHTNSSDGYTGRDKGNFNGQPVLIDHIPYKRPNNTISIPTRNECLALSLSKLNRISWYKDKFKEVFKTDKIEDRHLSQALTSFVVTHVSNDTPYDRWLRNEDELTNSQLMGLSIFFTPLGEEFKYKDKVVKGAGCFNCHDQGTFGGTQFHSLGVRSDYRSSLARAAIVHSGRNGFFNRPRLQRGRVPECHIKDITVAKGGLAPDMGKANQSSETSDCFKMRVPPLRNVIETFPYYHHGTERAKGLKFNNLEEQSVAALRNVILYHIRGPVNLKLRNRGNVLKPFFDDLHQVDALIPFYKMNFWGNGYKADIKTISLFPIELDEAQIDALVDFVAYGLWDKNSVREGALGNNLSHPKVVPSGLSPSITRDSGHQLEVAPNLK